MELIKGIRVYGKALGFGKSLVISDLHLGYRESLNNSGLLIPGKDFKLMLKEIHSLLEHVEPEQVILNGDIKHDFGTITKSEWKNVNALLDDLKMRCSVLMIRGNHDTILKPIADKKRIAFVDYYYEDGIYVCHGDEVPENDDFLASKTVIIGHQHASIRLRDKGRIEKYPCYLKTRYMDKNLIVMPAFHPCAGADATEPISPFMTGDPEVYVIDEKKILPFGKLSEMA